MKQETKKDSLGRLRYYLRQAQQGVPVSLAMLAGMLIGLWFSGHWFQVPSAIKAILIGVAALSLIGEVVAVLHLRAKIRHMTGEVTREK